MNPKSIPSLEDVLDAYALEADNDNATLERYLRDYPQHAAELVELSRELDRPVDVSTTPLTEADHVLIAQAWTQFVSASGSATSTPLLALQPAKMREIAGTFGLPRQVLSAFRERRVVVESVPRYFLERLAEALGTPFEAFRTSLARAPNSLPRFAENRSYKGDEKPEVPQQVTFEQLLVDARVPPDKIAELMGKKD